MALREVESQSSNQILGHNGNYWKTTVTLLQDAGAKADTVAGTFLGQVTASKKFSEYNKDGVGGLERAAAILADTVSAADRKAGDVAVSVYFPQSAVFRASKLVGEDANGLADLGAVAVKPKAGGSAEFYII